ncbi:hypothetical protein [Eisenibacter elegans]|jgi:DNA-directed RNA polymerase subunit F|uniref:hypothetical protein n=1 Tax=Eisenibacter elegans TaxID=997 RepID=UPI00047E7405|nr:hypothetical protein [Eisenibacter elegans]
MATDLSQIEQEISRLTAERGQLFTQWANTVKHNQRLAELNGVESPELVAKAESLLAAHNAIREKILELISRADRVVR